MRYLFAFLSVLAMATSPLPLTAAGSTEPQIAVDNKILAKVNGKVITVVDVMKKLDIQFYRQFPEYAAFPDARLQFYEASWKRVLQDLIDKELVLADANALKLPLSNGDVRQEMEQLFGPNIIANLDKINLPYEEAWEIVRGDILIRRMFYIRVNNKALKKVTPQVVRETYENYIQSHIKPSVWHYRILAIRDIDATRAAELAQYAYNELSQGGIAIENIEQAIRSDAPGLLGKKTSLTLSEEFHSPEPELSESYKKVLEQLSPGSYSIPLSQKSRTKGALLRIFYLQGIDPGGVPLFADVEAELQEKLLEDAASNEADLYLAKLRSLFSVESSVLDSDSDFTPFRLIEPVVQRPLYAPLQTK